MTYQYEWPRPALTTDIAIFHKREDGEYYILLIKRKNEPYKGYWALPGGYVEENEPIDHCAMRELEEETNLINIPLTQVGAWGDPGRDPRGWQVTVAFYGVTDREEAVAGDDAADATWYPVGPIIQNGYLDIACDHREIIQTAFDRMLDNE